MTRAAAILVVLSCSPALANPPLPAHYAKLFVPDTTWTYDVTVTTWDYDKISTIDTPNTARTPWPKRTEKQVATCKVAQVAMVGGSPVSEITCDPAIDKAFDRTLPGIYVAGKSGLGFLPAGDFPPSQDYIDSATLLIVRAPRVSRTTERDAVVGYTATRGVRKTRAAWCTYATFRGAAHDGTASLCFDGQIASGGDDIAGELHDMQFRAR